MSPDIEGIDAAMEEFFWDPTSELGMILLGIQAAFPSIGWGWLGWVLHRMGMGEWLIRAVSATLGGGSSVELLLGGHHTCVHIGISRGIKHGRPATGSLLALGYAPVIRCPIALRPAMDLRGFLVMGDIGLMARFVTAFLAVMFPYFNLVRKAVGRALRCGKTAVLCWGASGTAEIWASHRMQVRQADKVQGTALDTGGPSWRWAAPTQKYLARVRHVRLVARMVGLTVSVPDARAVFCALLGSCSHPMAGAAAMLTGAPMHSLGLGIAGHLSAIGAANDFGCVELMARASQLPLLAANPDMCTCLEDTCAAKESDDAAFRPRCPGWSSRPCARQCSSAPAFLVQCGMESGARRALDALRAGSGWGQDSVGPCAPHS